MQLISKVSSIAAVLFACQLVPLANASLVDVSSGETKDGAGTPIRDENLTSSSVAVISAYYGKPAGTLENWQMINNQTTGTVSGVMIKGNGNVIGCLFEGNIATASDREDLFNCTGVIRVAAGTCNLIDTSFRNNYSVGEKATGGAVSGTMLDSIGGAIINVFAKNADVVFEGNKRNAVRNEDGSITGGIANAIWMDTDQHGVPKEVSVDASAGKSVTFYDPIVHNVNTFLATEDGLGQHTIALNCAAGSTGTIVFSGEKYLGEGQDLSRMTQVGSQTGMTQKSGTVAIRKEAIVGASLDSTTKADAKAGALNYVMNGGRLEVTGGGMLMAGSFSAGDAGPGAGNNAGFDNCTLSVGDGARLTTGYLFLDQGLQFDLSQFLQDGNSGLTVNIVTDAPNTLMMNPVYGSDVSRIMLGGTLGISDTLNYNDAFWGENRSFLLLNFTKDSLTNANMDLTQGFDNIQSLSTGSSKVEGKYANNGEWTQEMRDGVDGSKQLYAVWKYTGAGAAVPETSSATLGLLGLGLLVLRRRRI